MAQTEKIVVSKKDLPVEHGFSGTDIFSGYLEVDYSSKWNTIEKKCETIEEMVKSDGSIASVLDAVKSPILGAKCFVRPATDEEKDEKNADFIDECLFDNMDFQSFLVEVCSYFEYGFAIFEKNFKVKDGKIIWKNFAFREQKSIESWSTLKKEWIDGHPDGITQRINGADDSRKFTLVEIPWWKIMRFTRDQKGLNYEGESLIRRAYIHWYMKNTLYKISAISSERFGVGIPFIGYSAQASDNNIENFETFLKNIRSNEQQFLSYPKQAVEEWGMKTPDGGSVQNSLMLSLIDHHDKKIYDSVLAGFLNLTSGEGGSNALSADQSSFFLKCLQKEADYIAGVINTAIKELCDLNGMDVSNGYPEFVFGEIGQKNIVEYIGLLTSAKDSGLIGKWTESDAKQARELLGLSVEDLEMEEEMEEGMEEIEQEEGGGEYEMVGDVEGEEMEDVEDEEIQKEIDDIKEMRKERDFLKEVTSQEYSDFECEDVSCFSEIEEHIEYAMEQDTKSKISDALIEWWKTRKKKDVPKGKVQTKKEEKDTKSMEIKSNISNFKKEYDSLKAETDALKGLKGKENTAKRKEINARKSELSKKRNEILSSLRAEKEKIAGELKVLKEEVKKKKEEIKSSCKAKMEALKNYAEEKKIPTKREKVFIKNISDFENYISSEYQNGAEFYTEAEKKLKEKIVSTYKKLDQNRIGGVTRFVNNQKTKEARKMLLEEVKTFKSKLETKFIDSPFMRRIFDNAKKMALKTVQEDEAFLKEQEGLAFAEKYDAKIASFMRAYSSNMKGVIFNDPRKYEEIIDQHLGALSPVDLAITQVENHSGNLGILNLSLTTHPRSAFSGILNDSANERGITNFKAVVSSKDLKRYSPDSQNPANKDGMTASILFRLLTAYAILEMVNKETEGSNADPLSGMNIHHNGRVYFYPVPDSVYDEEEEIAKEQRSEFLSLIK